MTKQDLLRASIKEFEDFKENALLWKCKRVFTASGYAYLIKQSSEPISCAFHFAKNFETSEEIGKYENVEITLNTRKEIGFDDSIITYKDLTVALLTQGNYNETMAQWHYHGVGSFSPISNKFLITDESEIEENLGVNSMEIMLNLQKDYPMVPSYFEAKSEKKYIMVDVEEQGVMSGVLNFNSGGILQLWKKDAVKLTFVNFNRDEALKEINRIQNASLDKDTNFGFCSTPDLSNKYLYQLAFNWKSLTYVSNFEINYWCKSTTPEEITKVKQLIYNALQWL